jgi:hypothetical protein
MIGRPMPVRITALLLLVPALAAQAAVKTASHNGGEATSPFGPDAPPVETMDAASARGLRWLAQQQLRSGAWTGIVGHKQNDSYHELDNAVPVQLQRAQDRGHTGVTALCGMAFLAGGHLPDRGPYAEVVRKTIAYVMAHAGENGFLTDSGTRMYSHAFATLFLAEAYGMSGGPDVKLALERAVQLITDTQNQHGGWRYNPFDREVDLSVTVCQVQALRAARNIGIRVPVQTIDRAVAYVQRSRTARGRDKGLYYYKIVGRGAYEKNHEYAINAAAVTALNSAGIYDPEQIDTALDFLLREYGDVARYYGDHFYFWYGNYYACQAFFQSGGDRFRRYYSALAKDLLAMQRSDGRWIDRVGPGDEFSTAVACMLLQLPKQYLPIFQR